MLKNRPYEITKTIQSGRSPILPYEWDMLIGKLDSFGVKQRVLGTLLGEAMEQSSETWHDNAPAEVINADAFILTAQAERIIKDLSMATIFCYPSKGEKRVTLGSVIGIVFSGENTPENYLLSGLVREVPEIRLELPNNADLSVITVRSHLGSAVLGGGSR